MDVAEPTCIASKTPPPQNDESCSRVKPLVVANRTGSRRNSSLYLFAILNILHSIHRAKETEAKPEHDHGDDARNEFYENMKRIRMGDVVFAGAEIKAVGICSAPTIIAPKQGGFGAAGDACRAMKSGVFPLISSA